MVNNRRGSARHEEETVRTEEVEEHLPEWVQIFGQLQREAEEAYPDERLRVIIPRRKKQSGSGKS